jgi:undecaprenyl diphosphate synthase
MSTNFAKQSTPKRIHAAIIMDGNGRWALARGLPRIAGHRAGADAVRRVVEAAPELHIATLTLFAFSADNWQRPAEEVSALMQLLVAYIQAETPRCVRNGVRLLIIGRRDRLDPDVVQAIAAAEAATAAGERLCLRIAVDYSAREAITQAARCPGSLSRERLARRLGPDVDLLIRTGGEQRLSDFLLWECAYAELIFTRRMWPDFDRANLEAAVRAFYSRERRFGRVPDHAALSPVNGRQTAAWLE